MKMLGEDIQVKDASEPTDIIWENRHIQQRTRHIRRLIVWIIVCFMLSCSAATIYYMTKLSIGAKERYPVVNCKDTEEFYGGDYS